MLEDKELLVVQLDLSAYPGNGSGWKSLGPGDNTSVYAAGIPAEGVTVGNFVLAV